MIVFRAAAMIVFRAAAMIVFRAAIKNPGAAGLTI